MTDVRRAIDCRVEYEHDPPTVRRDAPRFSWRARSVDRDEIQTAYRVVVADDREPLLEPDPTGDDYLVCWDSGRVESARSTAVEYDGASLPAESVFYWRVRIWIDGDPMAWSPVNRFETVPDPADWDGEWITRQPDGGDSNGFRTPWRQNDRGSAEWVQVDLGEQVRLSSVGLHPSCPFDGPTTPDGATASALYSWDLSDEPTHTREGPDGFGFPRRYRIDIATDENFEDRTIVVDRTDEQVPNPGSDTVRHDVDATVRYVRVVAAEPYIFDPDSAPQAGGDQFDEDDGVVRAQTDSSGLHERRSPWSTFALAALSVRDENGTDVARGATVASSASHENDVWGRSFLVDGRYRSEMVASSPLLRTELSIDGAIDRARVHVAALGYGELYVNGDRVGDQVLNPAWTQYDETVLYSTHDVTHRLCEGENAIGLWLGRGRFGQNFFDWTGFGSPRALVRVVLEYADGTRRTLQSGPSWRVSASPILENDLYDGETYDARREQSGWAEPGFDAAEWNAAAVVPGPGGELVPQRTDPIRVVETRSPERVLRSDQGQIVDAGQNLTGWVRLDVRGTETGDRLDLRYAERLTDDGELDRRTLRTAAATDTYVSDGEDETYEPRFTSHGFRYVEINGHPETLSLDDVEVRVVHTDLESTGSFSCSNDDLESVHRNARWSLRGNAHGVPTDCPQRDERFGWTGDGRITAAAYLYEFDAIRFYEKWLRDHDDAQTAAGYLPDTIPHGPGSIPSDPSWTVTMVRIPWLLYRRYGDEQVLDRHYDRMREYVNYWHTLAEDGFLPGEYGNYGDWLALEHLDERGVIGRPKSLFITAAHYETTETIAKIASVLGYDRDAEAFRHRADEIAAVFNDRFFDPATATYGPGTQAAYAVPIHLGIVPDAHEDRVLERFVERVEDADAALQTGFLGTRALIFALAECGHADLAYRVVSRSDSPGWVHMVRQGATTLWEAWNVPEHLDLDPEETGVRGDVVSLNHPSFAFVSEWFHAVLGGVRPGFDGESSHVRIAPQTPTNLEFASASTRVPTGTIKSDWERTDDGFVHRVTVPWNASATVILPGSVETGLHRVVHGGVPVWSAESGVAVDLPVGVRSARLEDGSVYLTVGSGHYEFTVEECA